MPRFSCRTIRHLVVALLLFLLTSEGRSQSGTNIGTEFWVAFPPNAGYTATLQLYISSTVATSGSIHSAYPGVDQDFTVIPGVVNTIPIPSLVALSTGTEDKGIHITANDPIAVYGLNNQNASTDAFMALPVTALGNDYRVMSYRVAFAGNASCFSVVATQDGTNVTIFNKQTSTTYFVALNAGQTHQVEATGLGEDLTGSRVQSDHPVAVFGSVDMTQVPTGCIAADHIVEQMFPVYAWGKNYVTVPLAGRDTTGDIFRILAASDATDVLINGSYLTTLNAGEFEEEALTGYNSIECSKAVMVAQFAKGQNCSGSTIGDPFMMLLFPREQYLTGYEIVNVAGVSPFISHWVNVVAPEYALGTIFQDGELIPDTAFRPIPATGFYGARREVTQGSHQLSSSFPFGVSVYGWRAVDSYGYPGGGSMSPVATVASVTLSPDTLTGQLNITNLCFTAHVANDLGNPVAGILVTFHISGIAPLTGNAYTNASGDAQFCYIQTGAAAGTDHVYAEAFSLLSDTSVVIWTYDCLDPVSGGTIGADQSGCEGFIPAVLTSITLPAGQQGILEYKWQSSVVSASAGYTDIADSDSPGYDPGPVFQTTWFRRLARVTCKTDWSTSAVSNTVEITVISPVPVSVDISVSVNPVCAGLPVTFTANASNAGSTPSYQWIVNAGSAGNVTNASYVYIPAEGDSVWCLVMSNEPCAVNNPAMSNVIVMSVSQQSAVGISISASANPVCAGTAVTFSAAAMNGGAMPMYQWQVNGVNAGANSSSYAYVPGDEDSVTCTVMSNEQCAMNNPAISNVIVISNLPAPAVSLTACFDTLTTFNAKPFRLKGGLPLNGTWSGPGVSGGFFNPAAAGTGPSAITYTYTNASSCSAQSSVTIVTRDASPFSCGNTLTDIRDQKTYPTALIGTRCWMIVNLDLGTRIPSNQLQYDNCVVEKYCYGDQDAECMKNGGLYRWDELMNYESLPGAQGLCPAGWHVPDEGEWTDLCDAFLGFGLAGVYLTHPVLSAFEALPGGVCYLGRQWSFGGFATLMWTSTPAAGGRALSHGLNLQNYSVALYPAERADAFAVRCVQD